MTATPPGGGIDISGITKIYQRGAQRTEALATLDLSIGPGEFVSIVGPSGCGKSTLLRLIAGLTPTTSGAISVFGRAVGAAKKEIGIVFQSPTLLDWRTVLGNVMFQVEMRDLKSADYEARARDLLEQVGLGDFLDRYPYELSGGMRQRASIARALVHDPTLLMMDEPFGALDALTREQMRLDLEQIWLKSRKTVLFITHSIDEAVLLSDRVVVMSPRPGRIERIIPIDMPRPRGIEARKHPRFVAVVDEITEIFLARGVLHRGRLGGAASP